MKLSLIPFLGLVVACAAITVNAAAAAQCPRVGEWMRPLDGAGIAFPSLLDDLTGRPATLLGESHTSSEDHAWQLQTLAALYGRTSNMVIGFEAFPRRLQPVLDRWVAGELGVHEFLAKVEWTRVWGYPASLYMPLFEFARMNRIPMVALNVDRELVARVGREGWDAIPQSDREGVGTPAPASKAYVDELFKVFAQHHGPAVEAAETGGTGMADPHGDGVDVPAKAPEKAAMPGRDSPGFRRFVEAQLTWDRAMAEAVATAHARMGHPLVVAILGRGHVEYGFGVPHQLHALGVERAAALVTWPADRDCAELVADGGIAVADAVFGVEPEPEMPAIPQGPTLGVLLEPADGGVRISGISKDSVAQAAGLAKGDVVRAAAGRAIASPGDLATIVQRQPFGTWLPLEVMRDGRKVEVIAKFPARPHPPMKGPSPHQKSAAP